MRLDRFLSVARIFKSRSLAAEAIVSSMVFIDNLAAKPAREVRVGTIIEIDTPRFYRKIEVLLLPEGNFPKKEALQLYRQLEERIKN
jgi:ribosomal 50S subunit-recycling heat shock protein